MGCIKLHILDEQYKSTELKVSYINKKLTSKNSAVNPCRCAVINRIDPNGKDDYQLDNAGKINFVKQTNANTHTIYASKANGRIDRRNSINVSKDVLNYSTQNTVQDGEETFTTNTYQFLSGKEATQFFRFAAKNSNVEWTNVSASYTDNSGTTNFGMVGTSHDYGKDVSIDAIIKQMSSVNTNFDNVIAGENISYQINKFDHNHTNGSISSSWGDVNTAKRINALNGHNNAVFEIYIPKTGRYHSFNVSDIPGNLQEVEIIGTAPRKP